MTGGRSSCKGSVAERSSKSTGTTGRQMAAEEGGVRAGSQDVTWL